MGNLAKSCRLFLFVCANVDVDAAEFESFKVSYNRFYDFSLEVVHNSKKHVVFISSSTYFQKAFVHNGLEFLVFE